ncbi:hypothetical protein ScPMuIL_005109 [Solemya velum]
MVAGEAMTFTLTGGGPWGFRLQGGDDKPIRIAKIRKKSKAHSGGVKEGDTILSINGEPVSGKTHQGAMDLVDSAEENLCLEIIRGSIPQSSHASHPQSSEESQQPPQDVAIGEKSITPTPENSTAPESTIVQSFTSSHTETDGETTRSVTTEARSETVDGKTSQSFVQHQTESNVGEKPVSSLTYHESGEPFMPSFAESAMLNDSSSKSEETIAESKENIAKPAKDMSVPVFNVKNVKTGVSSSHAYEEETVTVSKENIAPSFNVRNVRHETSTTQMQSMFDPSQVKEQRQEKPPPTVFRVKNVKDGALYKNPPPPVSAKPKRKPKTPLGENVPQFNIKDVGEKPGGKWQPTVTVTATTKRNYHADLTPADVERTEHSYHSLPSLYGPPDTQHHVDGEFGEHHRHHPAHLHIFGPPVEFHQEDEFPSMGSEPGTPDTTSTGWSKRKLYADSAFYDDHDESYPTIDDQMKLCKIIATSLTSKINKRARGARMFARRKKKSATWIHQGQSGFSSEKSSSTGDVADLHDLESELSPTDGGLKPLFSFRIPSVAIRVTPSDGPSGKMTLSQDEFENLRLTKSKCDHRSVSPNTCFSIVEDLQSAKGKGSRMFQKRLAKSEKWVVDETNAKKPMGGHKTKLDDLLTRPHLSPWEAAGANQYGMVDDAFRHLNDDDRMQKIKDSLETKYKKAGPSPIAPQVPKPIIPEYPIDPIQQHKLEQQDIQRLMECPDFNRKAKGWGSYQTAPDPTPVKVVPDPEPVAQPPAAPPKPILKRDYNPSVRGWGGPQQHSYPQENGMASNTNSLPYQQQPGYYTEPYGGHVPAHQYQPQSHNMLPGCDL